LLMLVPWRKPFTIKTTRDQIPKLLIIGTLIIGTLFAIYFKMTLFFTYST